MLQTLSLHIPTQSANASDEWYIANPHKGTWRIVSAYFAPATAVAIDGTDYFTVTLSSNDGAASSDVTIASHNTNTGGTALVLKTSIALTLSGAGLQLSQGGQIKVAKVHTASGKILDGTYTFGLEKVN